MVQYDLTGLDCSSERVTVADDRTLHSRSHSQVPPLIDNTSSFPPHLLNHPSHSDCPSMYLSLSNTTTRYIHITNYTVIHSLQDIPSLRAVII